MLADDEKEPFPKVRTAFSNAVRYIHGEGDFNAKMLWEEPVKALHEATREALLQAVEDGIETSVPDEMYNRLKNDVFVFSGMKTYAQLKEVSSLLLDDKGNIKPFATFAQQVKGIDAKYNRKYLESEYQFASSSAQMASKWKDLTKNGDRYNLQYRTAQDDRVRPAHQALANITLPPSDSFWASYYPPNGWRCRCTAVEVLKSKYEQSDSDEAVKLGEKATTRLDKDGKNADAMFRFNPGIQQVIFPQKHPYYQLSKEAKKEIEKAGNVPITEDVKGLAGVNAVLQKIAETHPEYFERGFKKLAYEVKKNANGSTDMRGTISLKKERVNLIAEGLNLIRAGKTTAMRHEDAFSTLWHEITHNRSKTGNAVLTKTERLNMELANEFVSRNTLPQFMRDLGGELHNKSLMINRQSTGYNTMVRNYDALIKWTEADKSKVVEGVKDHLFTQSYKTQMDGLIKAITSASPHTVKFAGQLVAKCRSFTEDAFLEELENSGRLLVKKK